MFGWLLGISPDSAANSNWFQVHALIDHGDHNDPHEDRKHDGSLQKTQPPVANGHEL
jgi:hypothetical protein